MILKNILRFGLVILIALVCLFRFPTKEPVVKSAGILTDKEYQELIVDLLYPKISEATVNYYKNYLKNPPGNDPNFIKILSIVPQKSDAAMVYPNSFQVELETSPYYGPHNSVGTDHITFIVDVLGNVKTERFEHIASYEIQPNYRDEIIHEWPPA